MDDFVPYIIQLVDSVCDHRDWAPTLPTSTQDGRRMIGMILNIGILL